MEHLRVKAGLSVTGVQATVLGICMLRDPVGLPEEACQVC